MTTTMLKKLLDACFVAKRVVETMEELPQGMKPRHIHVIDAIFDLEKQNRSCCVSDISNYLHTTTPSITKLINELEVMQAVEKYPSGADKRITLLRLTEKGKAYENRYVIEYHNAWVSSLQNISDNQAKEVIHVITQLQKTIPKESNV